MPAASALPSAAVSHAVTHIAGMKTPLEWVQTATRGVQTASRTLPNIPSMVDQSPFSLCVPKSALRVGDHIFVWKLGFTYNHHGIVVHTEECGPDCQHDTLQCCSIVHFQPPSEEISKVNGPGRIEIVSLAGFLQGRGVCQCKYGVPNTEFYLRRSGVCSTYKEDPWPVAVLRALSVVEVAPQDNGGAPAAPDAAQVEYDLLKKNNELFAAWCKVGSACGVQRFRSQEQAFSNQSAPGRFVRLGVAVGATAAVASAAVISTAALTGGTVAAAGGAAGGQTAVAGAAAGAAAEAAVVGAAGGTAAAGAAAAAGGKTAAAAGGVATSAAARAGAIHALSAGSRAAAGQAVRAGSLAASSAAQSLLVDIARRPDRAMEVFSQVKQTVPLIAGAGGGAMAVAGRRRDSEATTGPALPGAPGREQQEALLVALKSCFRHMGIRVPKGLTPLLDSPIGSSRLCEMLVDVLEAAEQIRDERSCQALVQRFLDDLHA